MTEKNLTQVFSKDEVLDIAKNIIGRDLVEKEIDGISVEVYDHDSPQNKLLGVTVKQKILIPIYADFDHGTAMYQIQIWSNGLVKYVTFSGTDLGILHPLPVYEAIVAKKAELEEIEQAEI